MLRSTAVPTAALLGLLLAAPPAVPAGGASDGRHRVEWPDGRVDPEASFRFDAAADEAFGPLRLVRERPAPPSLGAAPPEADAVELELWNGDRLSGRLAPGGGGGEGLGLLVGGERGLSLEVPIDALRRVAFPGRRAAAGAEELGPPEVGDRLYRLAGTGVDVLDGTLDGFEPDGLAFESRLGRRTYPWTDVVALFVEPLDPPEETRGAPRSVAVDLSGGGRLHGLLERFDGERLHLRLPWDELFVADADAVLLCSTDDGRLAYLSEREPDRVEGGSAFGDDLGLVFRPAADRAVHGGALVAGGRLWPRGIGVQAPTTLAFRLEPGTWSRLEGAVAVDDSTERLGARGSVVFAVRADGRERWRSEVVRGGRAPLPLPSLSLDGVTELELVVEMGPDLNLGDRADWLDLRLVR